MLRSIADVREAIALIDRYSGAPETFLLCLAESLHDAVGINIAMVTDRILAKGWEPSGIERFEGYRIYRYKRME